MFECASVNANPNRRHFLLFAPCNSFAVIVVTLDTQSLLTTHFSNYIAMVSNDMMFQTVLITAASVNFRICLLTACYCTPFTIDDTRNRPFLTALWTANQSWESIPTYICLIQYPHSLVKAKGRRKGSMLYSLIVAETPNGQMKSRKSKKSRILRSKIMTVDPPYSSIVLTRAGKLPEFWVEKSLLTTFRIQTTMKIRSKIAGDRSITSPIQSLCVAKDGVNHFLWSRTPLRCNKWPVCTHRLLLQSSNLPLSSQERSTWRKLSQNSTARQTFTILFQAILCSTESSISKMTGLEDNLPQILTTKDSS